MGLDESKVSSTGVGQLGGGARCVLTFDGLGLEEVMACALDRSVEIFADPLNDLGEILQD